MGYSPPGSDGRPIVVLDWERSPHGWRVFIFDPDAIVNEDAPPQSEKFSEIGEGGELRPRDGLGLEKGYYLHDELGSQGISRHNLIGNGEKLLRCRDFDLVIENSHLKMRTDDSSAQVYDNKELEKLHQICVQNDVRLFEFPNVMTKRARKEAGYSEPFEDWTKPQLKQELERLGLSKEGDKPVLLKRLREEAGADERSDAPPKHHDPDAICHFILRRCSDGPNRIPLKPFKPPSSITARENLFWGNIAEIRLDCNKRLNIMRNASPNYDPKLPDVKNAIDILNKGIPKLDAASRKLIREHFNLSFCINWDKETLRTYCWENKIDNFVKTEDIVQWLPEGKRWKKSRLVEFAREVGEETDGTKPVLENRIRSVLETMERGELIELIHSLFEDERPFIALLLNKEETIIQLDSEPLKGLSMEELGKRSAAIMAIFVCVFERTDENSVRLRRVPPRNRIMRLMSKLPMIGKAVKNRHYEKAPFIGIRTIWEKLLTMSPYKGQRGGLARSNLMWHNLGKRQGLENRWSEEDDISKRQRYRKEWRMAVKILMRLFRDGELEQS